MKEYAEKRWAVGLPPKNSDEKENKEKDKENWREKEKDAVSPARSPLDDDVLREVPMFDPSVQPMVCFCCVFFVRIVVCVTVCFALVLFLCRVFCCHVLICFAGLARAAGRTQQRRGAHALLLLLLHLFFSHLISHSFCIYFRKC